MYSWSGEADPGHGLKYTTDLTPPVIWLDVTNQVQMIAGQNVVNILPASSNLFFELQ